MPTTAAATQFDTMAENGRPSCEDVKRLFERVVDRGELLELEKHLYDVCRDWGLDLRERPSIDFPCLYMDGQNRLVRVASNGYYLVHLCPIVEGYTDHDRAK
jgi:hypothetical protein